MGRWHAALFSFSRKQQRASSSRRRCEVSYTLHAVQTRLTTGGQHLQRCPHFLTPAEVAAWLKTTISAVYAKAERGTLPGATRLGRRLYFIRAELLAYVEQGRVSQSGGPGGGT